MSKYFLALLLLSPVSAFAAGTAITASGGSPIPSAYSASDTQSQVRICQGNVVEILNGTSTVIGVAFGTSTSAPSTDYTFVPGGPASGHSIKPKGGLGSGTYVYIRGASSITSGTVYVSCYFEE